jgi:hypothetical protein
MEISDVRRQLTQMLERAKREAGERRVQHDEAARDYAVFLERVAVPLFRQVANVLKAQGYAFRVFTPSESVRLMSEARADDYIELALDASGGPPAVIGSIRIARGRRVVESERRLGTQPIRELTEADVLNFLLTELEPFLVR